MDDTTLFGDKLGRDWHARHRYVVKPDTGSCTGCRNVCGGRLSRFFTVRPVANNTHISRIGQLSDISCGNLWRNGIVTRNLLNLHDDNPFQTKVQVR